MSCEVHRQEGQDHEQRTGEDGQGIGAYEAVLQATHRGGQTAVGGLSTTMRRLQNGFVRSYALSVLAGALLVVLALLAVNLA